VGGEVIVFGGTFDPVHLGHLSIAEQVRSHTDAESVWLLPAGHPLLRDAPIASQADRLAMLEAAVEGREGLRVCAADLWRDAPSHTFDSMRSLRAAHPGTSFTLLVGADSARTVPRWWRSRDLLASENFVIVNRHGAGALTEADAAALGFRPGHHRLVQVDSPDISASEVRRRIAAGGSVADLVPAAVADLIAARGLYTPGAAPMHNALG